MKDKTDYAVMAIFAFPTIALLGIGYVVIHFLIKFW